MLDCNANTNHNNTHTGGKQIYKSVLNCMITQICGTRIGYWMDSNNKSKPDDNQLIFDLSSLQWLFWGNWSGFDRKSGNISSMCNMLHKIWFTLQIRNIFCTNTNQGSYKYESGCATNRSIVSWPWLTASDRGRDSCLLDGIHLVYTQTIHEVAQILIKFCTNIFKILYKYKSGWSRKRCVVGSWRYKPISHKNYSWSSNPAEPTISYLKKK